MDGEEARQDNDRLWSELSALEDERRRFAMSIRDGGGYNPAVHENWKRLDREVAHVRSRLGLPAEAKPKGTSIKGWVILAGFVVGLVVLLVVLTTLSSSRALSTTAQSVGASGNRGRPINPAPPCSAHGGSEMSVLREHREHQERLSASSGYAPAMYSRPWAWFWTGVIGVGSGVAAGVGAYSSGVHLGWSLALGVGALLLSGGGCVFYLYDAQPGDRRAANRKGAREVQQRHD